MDETFGLHGNANGDATRSIFDARTVRSFLDGETSFEQFLKHFGVSWISRKPAVKAARQFRVTDPRDVLHYGVSYPPETLQRILNSGNTEIVDLFVRHNLVPYDVKHKDAMRREFLARSLNIHDPEEIAKKFVFLCTGDDAKFVTTLAAEMTIRQLIDQGLFERHFSERFKQFTDQIRGTTRLADQFRMVKALSEKIVELVDNPILAARSVTDISHPEQILSLGDLATLTHKAHSHIATHTCSPEDVAFLDEFIFRSISHITRKTATEPCRLPGYKDNTWNIVCEDLKLFGNISESLSETLPRTGAAIDSLLFLGHVYADGTHDFLNGDARQIQRSIVSWDMTHIMSDEPFCENFDLLVSYLRADRQLNSNLLWNALKEGNVVGDSYFALVEHDRDMAHALGRLLIDAASDLNGKLPLGVQKRLSTDDRWGLTLLHEGYREEGYLDHLAQVCGPVTYAELVDMQYRAYAVDTEAYDPSIPRLEKDVIFELGSRFDEMCAQVEADSTGAYNTARLVLDPKIKPDEIARRYVSGGYHRNVGRTVSNLLTHAGIDQSVMTRNARNTGAIQRGISRA